MNLAGYKDLSAEDALKPQDKYYPASFANPVEMLFACDERLQSGELKLNNWQAESMHLYAYPGFNKDNPLKYLVCAANGSGKDSYFISPCAVWEMITKVRSRFIITSSSFNQLKNQTEPGIRAICMNINKLFGKEIIHMKQFHFIAKNTGSEILIFATDEAGLAEGYHPFSDSPSQRMTICVNESKTVKDEIFGALKRCKGYTHWLEVSSAGGVSGHFYHTIIHSVQHPEKYPFGKGFYSRRVTSYECHHISHKEIEADKKELGEHSVLFRSIHLSEFTSAEESVVIPRELINKSLASKIEKKPGKCYVGLDFSRGGDETAGVVIHGNSIAELRTCRIHDSVNLAVELCRWLNDWKVKYGLEEDNVIADDGGIGAVILDMMRRQGWEKIVRITNQSPAINKLRYRNRGAELWYNVRILLEHDKIHFGIRDEKLIDQLSARYYEKLDATGALKLETKAKARASGHCSPDRADALVLALSKVRLQDIEVEETGTVKVAKLTIEDLLNNPELTTRKQERVVETVGFGAGIRRMIGLGQGRL